MRILSSWLILWIKSLNAILSEMFYRILPSALRPPLFLRLSVYPFFRLLFCSLYPPPPPQFQASLNLSSAALHLISHCLIYTRPSVGCEITHTLSVSLQRSIADPMHCSCSFGVYGSAKLVKTQLRSFGTRLCELNKLLKVFSHRSKGPPQCLWCYWLKNTWKLKTLNTWYCICIIVLQCGYICISHDYKQHSS